MGGTRTTPRSGTPRPVRSACTGNTLLGGSLAGHQRGGRRRWVDPRLSAAGHSPEDLQWTPAPSPRALARAPMESDQAKGTPSARWRATAHAEFHVKRDPVGTPESNEGRDGSPSRP